MNIKKLVMKILIGTFIAFSAFLLTLLLWTLFMFSGGIDPKMPIPADSLMSKTKVDIIEICFSDDAPKVFDRKTVNIRIKEKNQYNRLSYVNLYFKDIEEAKASTRLLNSNIWEIYKTTSFFSSKSHRYEVTFENSKSISVKITRQGELF